MTDRIDKLLVEAGVHFGGEGVVYDTFDPKKFAELLIQQCINVCEPVLDEPYEDISEFGKGLVEGQDVAVEKIKQHFGVEK
jgi:hypothetical protein